MVYNYWLKKKISNTVLGGRLNTPRRAQWFVLYNNFMLTSDSSIKTGLYHFS